LKNTKTYTSFKCIIPPQKYIELESKY